MDQENSEFWQRAKKMVEKYSGSHFIYEENYVLIGYIAEEIANAAVCGAMDSGFTMKASEYLRIYGKTD